MASLRILKRTSQEGWYQTFLQPTSTAEMRRKWDLQIRDGEHGGQAFLPLSCRTAWSDTVRQLSLKRLFDTEYSILPWPVVGA